MMLPRATLALILAATTALSGCGSDSNVTAAALPSKIFLSTLLARVKAAKTPPPTLDPVSLLALRNVLEKDGQPILLVLNPSLKYSDLMAPYGQNAGVQTWSSTSYTTISLRDGLVVATRGFGPDIMSATAPTLATLSAAQGQYRRSYYYLDGADQRQVLTYDCTLSSGGSQAISVLGKSFVTRVVVESCSGGAGSLTNQYWFDPSAHLRQSQQFLAPGLQDLTIQRIVD